MTTIKIIEMARKAGFEDGISAFIGLATFKRFEALVRADAIAGEPVAWIEHHKGGDNLEWDNPGGKCTPLYTTPPNVATPLAAQPAPTVQEPVAQAWDEGYRAGIDDERTSEANIGIAGFDAKVEPARNNPYRTTPPAAPVPLTDEQIYAIGKEIGMKCRLEGNPNIDLDYARAIEAAHGITEKGQQ
jgi:hypothetical protein